MDSLSPAERELMERAREWKQRRDLTVLTLAIQAVIALAAMGMYRVRSSAFVLALNPFFLMLSCAALWGLLKRRSEHLLLTAHYVCTPLICFLFILFALFELSHSDGGPILFVIHIPILVDVFAAVVVWRYTKFRAQRISELRQERQPVTVVVDGERPVVSQAQPSPVEIETVSRPPSADNKRPGNNDHLCCVCLESSVNVLIFRCGHVCLCDKCGLALKQSKQPCPICRQPILDLLKAYL